MLNIVQGSDPADAAQRVVAEHAKERAIDANWDKLDDELCRLCALARMVLAAEERALRAEAAAAAAAAREVVRVIRGW